MSFVVHDVFMIVCFFPSLHFPSSTPTILLDFSRCASSGEKAAKGSDAVGGGRAFGELNYLKPAQEQASFMSGSTQCRLCASRIHVLRARVHVRGAAASPGMNVLIMKVNLFRGVIN